MISKAPLSQITNPFGYFLHSIKNTPPYNSVRITHSINKASNGIFEKGETRKALR